MESQGSLWEGVLPGLLRQLYVGRRTGALVLSRETERRTVHFYVGNIANAETNVREDRMGEMLVRKGLLSGADLMRATGLIHRDRKRLGEVLMEMGLLDREGLREVVAFHADVVLSRVFAWTEGQYEFREDFGRELDAAELTLPYSTGDLILRASRSVQDPDVVRYRLGDLERLVALSRDPLLRFQRLNLSAVDGCVLARVDGRTSAGEIVLATRLVPEEVRSSLFALLNTGTIEYVEATGRGARPAAPARPPAATAGLARPTLPSASPSAPAGGELPPLAARAGPVDSLTVPHAPARSEPSIVLSREPVPEDDRVPLARPDVPPGSEPGTAAPQSAAERPAPPPIEARRAEIREAYESLATRTHFELLGLTPEADDAQLREAYFRVAKRFHPDAHHDSGLSDLRDKLEAVFVRLGEVYETLRSPRLRARYERELARPTAGESEAAPADSELPEDTIARASECIVRERYWEALPLLERAIPRASGGVRQRGRVLLARIYARDPDWVGQAEELLQSVLQDEPGNTDVHFYLGLIYEHQGKVDRALDAFRKVLELEPQSHDARARVVELEQMAVAPERGSPRPRLGDR